MSTFAALDVSQETTAVCVVDDAGRIIGEKKIPTCPQAIASFLTRYALDRVGIETGPMAVWLWNELHDRGLPIICIDARHANAALKVRPNKTDRRNNGWIRGIRRSICACSWASKSKSIFTLRSKHVEIALRKLSGMSSRGFDHPWRACRQYRLRVTASTRDQRHCITAALSTTRSYRRHATAGCI